MGAGLGLVTAPGIIVENKLCLWLCRMMLSFYFRWREDDGMSGVLPTRISEGTSFYFLHILTMTMT